MESTLRVRWKNPTSLRREKEAKRCQEMGWGDFWLIFFLYFLYFLHERQYVIRPGNSENYFPVEKGLHLLSMGEKTIVKLI